MNYIRKTSMDASTILKKINQQLHEHEEPNAVKKESDGPRAVKFHFSRPDSSMKIDVDSAVFKVLENNILEIRNNKKYRLLDTSYIIAVEIGPSSYL